MKILIGYDGSECSIAALHDLKKAGLPETASATVLCFANVFLPTDSQLASTAATDPLMVAVLKARARAIEAVEKARATAVHGSELLKAEFPCWEVSAHGSSDSPTWGLIQEAEAWNADLIVVGSHGRKAVGRVILGSVAQRVVTNAPCSVRVARSYKEESPPPLHLVLGYDGSAASAAVVDAVAARVWPARTILDLVTVIEPMSIALALASLKNHPAGKIPRTKNYIRMWLKTMNESAAEKAAHSGTGGFLRGDRRRTPKCAAAGSPQIESGLYLPGSPGNSSHSALPTGQRLNRCHRPSALHRGGDPARQDGRANCSRVIGPR